MQVFIVSISESYWAEAHAVIRVRTLYDGSEMIK